MEYSSSCTGTTWQAWTSGSTTSGTSSNPWTSWVESAPSSAGAETHYISTPVNAVPNSELIQQQAERKKAQKRAVRRAKALLLSCLTPQQQQDYLETGSFNVFSPDGTKFRITSERSKNIIEHDGSGKAIQRLCIWNNNLPLPDQLLAQKLMIETQEAAFREIAHPWPM